MPQCGKRSRTSCTRTGAASRAASSKRLCIARTLALRPEVLLFDEPTAALDPISTLRVEETLQSLRESYCIAMVTHNLQQAARVSNVTAFMYLGELVEIGPTGQMFTAPKSRRTDDYVTEDSAEDPQAPEPQRPASPRTAAAAAGAGTGNGGTAPESVARQRAGDAGLNLKPSGRCTSPHQPARLARRKPR